VIALTPREAAYLSSLGVRRDRIRVIPNGVDRREFEGMRNGPAPGDGVTILFAGRCYPAQKGLAVLLRAMARLPPGGRVRLRIVGEDWGGYAVVSALVRGLHLEDRVTLVGRVERAELLREFARADIFVLPSLFDSFPLTLLEAMAAGLPVVATRVGGVPDVVEDGRTGLLVDPGDEDALAGALAALAADDALRGNLGRAGRERSSLYSWETIIPRIKRVYEEAVMERAS
jgi:glycosyltransferase involved in cell wall biosynthesis